MDATHVKGVNKAAEARLCRLLSDPSWHFLVPCQRGHVVNNACFYAGLRLSRPVAEAALGQHAPHV